MLLPSLLVLLPLAVAAGRPHIGPAEQRVAGQVVSRDKYVVEIAKGEDVDSVASKLEESGAKIVRIFKSDVFTGLSVESARENVDSLLSIEAVDQAWPVAVHWIDPRGLESARLHFGDISARNYSVHETTGVDRLHAQGITGKGVKVAVVDTGIDYRHSAVR